MMRIPGELLEYKQWVLWRRAEANGRITKIPISPWSGKAAACDKPQTWSTYGMPTTRSTAIIVMVSASFSPKPIRFAASI